MNIDLDKISEKDKQKIFNTLSVYFKNKNQEFMFKVNELSFNEARLLTLEKIHEALKTQRPFDDCCPICMQRMPHSMDHYYEYFQNVNDTSRQIKLIKEKIKKLKTNIKKLNQITIK